MNRYAVLTAGLVAAAAAPAFADPVSPDDEVPTASAPMPFVTMDRTAGDAAIGVEVGYPDFKSGDDTALTGTVLHFDLHGHYVDPASHFGAYANVPINYVSDGSSDGGSTTALGDIELGGIYALPTRLRELAVIFHVGVALPTGSKSNLAVNALSEILIRERDLSLSIPGVTLRIGASPIVRAGMLFARADVGLDLNLSNSSGDTDQSLLLGGGVGVQLGPVAVSGEVSMVHVFSSSDANGDQTGSTLGIAALALRYTDGPFRPYVAASLPLDSDSREVYHVALIAGASVELR